MNIQKPTDAAFAAIRMDPFAFEGDDVGRDYTDGQIYGAMARVAKVLTVDNDALDALMDGIQVSRGVYSDMAIAVNPRLKNIQSVDMAVAPSHQRLPAKKTWHEKGSNDGEGVAFQGRFALHAYQEMTAKILTEALQDTYDATRSSISELNLPDYITIEESYSVMNGNLRLSINVRTDNTEGTQQINEEVKRIKAKLLSILREKTESILKNDYTMKNISRNVEVGQSIQLNVVLEEDIKRLEYLRQQVEDSEDVRRYKEFLTTAIKRLGFDDVDLEQLSMQDCLLRGCIGLYKAPTSEDDNGRAKIALPFSRYGTNDRIPVDELFETLAHELAHHYIYSEFAYLDMRLKCNFWKKLQEQVELNNPALNQLIFDINSLIADRNNWTKNRVAITKKNKDIWLIIEQKLSDQTFSSNYMQVCHQEKDKRLNLPDHGIDHDVVTQEILKRLRTLNTQWKMAETEQGKFKSQITVSKPTSPATPKTESTAVAATKKGWRDWLSFSQK